MRPLLCALTMGLVTSTAAALVGCGTDSKDDGDAVSGTWDVRAEDTRELWIWLDDDFPEDEEYFTVTVSPTAVPAGPFEGGVEVALSFTKDSEGGDTGDTGGGGAPATFDVTAELLLDGEVVASAVADSDNQATLTDATGPATCVEGEACTLYYTVRASMDGVGVIVTGDAALSAWITGGGTPPADAKVSITDF